MPFPGSPFSGVFAAVITPIDYSGNIDFATFDRVVDFVMDRGVDGIVIGGATAEYVHFSVKDRSDLAAYAVRRMNGRGKVIAGVGASSIYSTLQLARCAEDAGSDLLLIPMPYFFRYEQQDLAAYAEAVANSVSAPCLLYNLPSFTNGLEVDTAIRLLESVPNLIGMKDSSGNRANLDPLAHARKNRNFSLFVGDDDLLLAALQAGWDGVVSGIACFMPELIRALYRSFREGYEDRALSYQKSLGELIEHVVRLPIPWGVRVGLAVRGIPNGPMHLPPSPGRLRQMEELREWLNRWSARSVTELSK
ncbi:MAG TPA: dihydrodipicolinate synthase family protein [Verrucomicrobiae bacterium]|nr:dihydrodipicolinate synthase family protein [Verrucomicrobiae bacterium]